jgi:hypothetical protein
MRRAALDIFDGTVPVDRLGDLDEGAVKRVVSAAKSLRLCLWGHAKLGGDLFQALGLPPPARGPGRPGKGTDRSEQGGR